MIKSSKRNKLTIAVTGLLTFAMISVGVQSAHAVTNLTFAALSGIDNNFKPVIAQWNKENPDIQVTVQTLPIATPDIIRSLSASSIAGNSPDIFNNLDVYSDQLSDVGFSEDLTKWFGTNGTIKRAAFNQAFLSSYVPINAPKQVTGLPIAADATVVFYNKSIFNAAKVALPKIGWSWDDMMRSCSKISAWGAKQKKRVWGLGAMPGGGLGNSIWQAEYNPLIHAMGGYVYDRNTNTSKLASPAALKAWKMLVQPWQNGCIPKYSISTGKTAPTFAGGQLAMEISVRALLPTYRAGVKNFDVMDLPQVKGGTSKYMVGGGSYGLGISASSENKAAAWKFINWFYTTTNGGINTLQEGYSLVPPTAQGIASGTWRSLPAPPGNIGAFARAIKNSFIAPKLPGQSGTVLEAAVQAALASILLKKVPLEKAFKAAEIKVTKSIKEELNK